MKYFIVADIHGFYRELQRALDKAGFDPEDPSHAFVSLGDLLDRGGYPLQCLQFVNGLQRKILIRGNHEDLLEELLRRKKFLQHDVQNGTADTVLDLADTTDFSDDFKHIFEKAQENEELKKYLGSLVTYAEVGDNVFVHGWIPCETTGSFYCPDSYAMLSDWRNGDWRSARWYNGMEAWSNGIRVDGKTIFCGHWHTSWGNSKLHGSGVEWDNPRSTNPAHQKADFSPFVDDGICAIDGAVAYTRNVNCVVLETDNE